MSDTINNKILRCTKVIPYTNYQQTIKEFHHVTGEKWIQENKRYGKGWSKDNNIDKYDGLERKRCKVDHQYYDGKGRRVIFTERFLSAHSEKSKKVDCPAKLEHDFHDLRKVNYLPLENWVKILIKDRLEEGVDVPTIVDLVNDKQEKKKEESARLEHSSRLYRDVTYEDVYNQYYKIMVRQTRMAGNDFSSVGLWLVELESKSYHTFLFGQSNPDTQVYNFGFGFIAP
ncbi:hypothetical protein INT45_006351, partial [Circinella minor]